MHDTHITLSTQYFKGSNKNDIALYNDCHVIEDIYIQNTFLWYKI